MRCSDTANTTTWLRIFWMKVRNYLLCVMGVSLVMSAYAQGKDPNEYALMTASDLVGNALSNITITNQTGEMISASGLFIASYDVNDCSACFGGVLSGDNVGGAMVSPVTFKPGQSVAIGQNFLYNM